MHKLFVLFTAVCLLTACNNDKDKGMGDEKEKKEKKQDMTDRDDDANSKSWTSDNKDSFVKTCTEGATANMGESKAEEYCNCALKKVMKMYPNPAEADQLTQDELQSIADACN